MENIPKWSLLNQTPFLKEARLVYTRDPKNSDWHLPDLQENQDPEEFRIYIGDMWVNKLDGTVFIAVMPEFNPETNKRGILWKKITQ